MDDLKEITRKQKDLAQLAIEAHHIIPVSEGGKDMLDNLITLCKDCHRGNSWQEIKRLMESRDAVKACAVSRTERIAN